MKKAVMLTLLVVMAIGMVPLLGHSATCSGSEIEAVGSVCVDEAGPTVTADGNDANGDYLGGWIQVNGDEGGLVCADSTGSPGDEDNSPTCTPA